MKRVDSTKPQTNFVLHWLTPLSTTKCIMYQPRCCSYFSALWGCSPPLYQGGGGNRDPQPRLNEPPPFLFHNASAPTHWRVSLADLFKSSEATVVTPSCFSRCTFSEAASVLRTVFTPPLPLTYFCFEENNQNCSFWITDIISSCHTESQSHFLPVSREIFMSPSEAGLPVDITHAMVITC